MGFPDVIPGLFQVKVDIRNQVGFGDHGQVGRPEHIRILQRFVVPLRNTVDDNPFCLAQVEQAGQTRFPTFSMNVML